MIKKKLPFYQNNQAPDNCPDKGHAGLWFERFFNQYTDEWEIQKQKSAWLKEHFDKKIGATDLLETKAFQQMQLTNALKGQYQVFTASRYFVTGMGNPHPVENGFSWHPTLGVPYLTGAAVKGLVRNWLEVWEDSDKEQLLKEWFGSNNKDSTDSDNENSAGGIIFFDAFPIEATTLKVDIMTPHMGNWYAKGDKFKNIDQDSDKVPADWHQPVPIPFLVTDKIKLLFSFAPRTPQSDIDLNQVMEKLQNALEYLGAGAKTAVGYGQMDRDNESNDNLKEKLKIKNMTEIERQLDQLNKVIALKKCRHGDDTSREIIELFKQSINWTSTDKAQLADLMRQFYDIAGWGKGKKKTARKNDIATLNLSV